MIQYRKFMLMNKTKNCKIGHSIIHNNEKKNMSNLGKCILIIKNEIMVKIGIKQEE